MKFLHRYLTLILIVVVVFTLILPIFKGGLSKDLLLLFSQMDNLKELLSQSDQISFVSYIFEIDLFLEILSKIIGTLSLLGLFYQFKKERNLEEAQFAMEISNNFLSNRDIQNIYSTLEASKNDHQAKNPFDVNDSVVIIRLANYLSFFEPVYDLINRKIINFDTVDQFAYRFFLATNNQFVQEILLCKKGKQEAWINIYKLHHEWVLYRKKKGLSEVWQSEFGLNRAENRETYERVINS